MDDDPNVGVSAVRKGFAALLMVAALLTLKTSITESVRMFNAQDFSQPTLFSVIGNAAIAIILAICAWLLGRKPKQKPE